MMILNININKAAQTAKKPNAIRIITGLQIVSSTQRNVLNPIQANANFPKYHIAIKPENSITNTIPRLSISLERLDITVAFYLLIQ